MQMSKKQEKRTIRFQVVCIMSATFFAVFALLYVLFSKSMTTMLIRQEEDAMRLQAALASSVLQTSVAGLPSLSSDWGEQLLLHRYLTNGSEAQSLFFMLEQSYDINGINIFAILDLNGEICFQHIHNYTADGTGLDGIYTELSNRCIDATLVPRGDLLVELGAGGFVCIGGDILYLRAHPIANAGDQRLRAGTLIIGRIINDNLLNSLSSGNQFSIQPLKSLPLAPDETAQLEREGNLAYISGDSITEYTTLLDYQNLPTLALSVSSDRSTVSEGAVFIRQVILVMAIGCMVALIIILKAIDLIVLEPITSLVDSVNSISPNQMNMLLAPIEANQELYHFSNAVNQMILRLETANESLYFNANYDPLTKLRNFTSAQSKISEWIATSNQPHSHMTVYYLGVDRFKLVNNSIGRSTGDLLIQQIAHRISKAFYHGDVILARVDGDRFLVAVPGIASEESRQKTAYQIFRTVIKPFNIAGRTINLTVSIGSATFPYDGRMAEILIKNAEIAMYHAKETKDISYIAYHPEFQRTLQQRLDMENRLRTAVNGGGQEFCVHFQPKVLLADGGIYQCEALIRWLSPNGLLDPGSFIPLAEESDLIIPITWWVIQACCRQAREFADEGVAAQISVNVPAQVLVHADFLDVLQKSGKTAGIDLRCLDIELTESTLLHDVEEVNRVLDALHKLGVEISVDDFGTGYSSLNYLQRLSVDRVKIDRSFISGVEQDEDSRTIVRAIVAMAKSLRMTVTAEGVETLGQYRFLREVGCDEIQGFLVAHPMPPEEYLAFIKTCRASFLPDCHTTDLEQESPHR